jgi:hypothetical protein
MKKKFSENRKSGFLRNEKIEKLSNKLQGGKEYGKGSGN